MQIKQRSIFWMAVLTIITFGLYYIYWSVKTKNEIKSLGADIPTAWLLIVPFGFMYFWYKYATSFVEYVKKDANVLEYFAIAILPYFLIFFVAKVGVLLYAVTPDYYELASIYLRVLQIDFIPLLVFQMGLNKFAKKNNQ